MSVTKNNCISSPWHQASLVFIPFITYLKKIIYLCLAMRGLHCCTQAFSSCCKQVILFIVVCWSLIEKAMAPHSSTLAWKIPWTEEPGGLQSRGSLRVSHDWETSLSHFTFIGENGNPLQCSCLEDPRDGGAWWAAVYGVAESRTRLERLSSGSSLTAMASCVVGTALERGLSSCGAQAQLLHGTGIFLDQGSNLHPLIGRWTPQPPNHQATPHLPPFNVLFNSHLLCLWFVVLPPPEREAPWGQMFFSDLFTVGSLTPELGQAYSCCWLVTKLYPTLLPSVQLMDCSLLGSSVLGISQARILEWVSK